jgi:hypothetical protein
VCQAKGDPACAKCAARLVAGSPDGGGGQPRHWCCSLDADVTLLLSEEEEEQYQQRSLKAALNSTAGLVPCPQAGCEGVAVAGGGAEPLGCTASLSAPHHTSEVLGLG